MHLTSDHHISILHITLRVCCYLLYIKVGVTQLNIMLLLYCTRYIVQCDKEQLLWYYITDHDLQGRVIDPINNNQPTCVDFLCEYTYIPKYNIKERSVAILQLVYYST